MVASKGIDVSKHVHLVLSAEEHRRLHMVVASTGQTINDYARSILLRDVDQRFDDLCRNGLEDRRALA